MRGLAKIAAETKGKNEQRVHAYLKQNYPEKTLKWMKGLDWKMQKEVPLSKIKMGRRPGGAREQEKVKNIANAVKDGKSMEPVVLVKLPNGDMKIADGFHRTLGVKHADKKSIKAWVADVNENNGPWDKEMHENKKNVGKTAFVTDGLAGLAKTGRY